MAETVWYFAYGSNMQAATFRGRRSVEPRSACAGRAPGWRIVFDKPPLLPIAEGFANIVPDPSAEVLGVLYEVTEDDLDHVEITEGVRIGNYARVALTVSPLSGAAPVTAFSLASDRRDASLRPSAHYLGLLVEGAIAHGLPAEYVEWLRAVPAQEVTPQSVEIRALIDGALKRRR